MALDVPAAAAGADAACNVGDGDGGARCRGVLIGVDGIIARGIFFCVARPNDLGLTATLEKFVGMKQIGISRHALRLRDRDLRVTRNVDRTRARVARLL